MVKRIVAVLAVVGACTVAAAVPSSAGQIATLSGTVACTEPGTYTITWTIEITGFVDGGEVDSAVLSGAAEGDITDSFSPNPFDSGDDFIVGSNVVSGDTVGTVTLDAVVVIQIKGPFDVELSADVELDGGCEAPPTSESTTTASTAPSAETRPTFTG
jgi:hypothetical protein